GSHLLSRRWCSPSSWDLRWLRRICLVQMVALASGVVGRCPGSLRTGRSAWRPRAFPVGLPDALRGWRSGGLPLKGSDGRDSENGDAPAWAPASAIVTSDPIPGESLTGTPPTSSVRKG